MWLITLRDLQFRRRRFGISVLGTSLVFAMALLLAGLSNGFRVEATNSVAAVGADAWVIEEGAVGPFTSLVAIPADLAPRVAADPGVVEAQPLVAVRRDFRERDELLAANVYGYALGGLGEPPVAAGRPPAVRGEAAVDRTLGFAIGRRFTIGDRRFRVVGLTEGLTAFAGVPNVYVALDDAQDVVFDGAPLATAIVTDGVPERAPFGFRALSAAGVREDLLRPIENGIRAIDQIQVLLWVIATTIIGAVVYLSALERMRDFAVLKAVGAAGRDLFVGLAAQAVLLALVAAGVSMGIAPLLGPQFPLPVAIPGTAFAVLPAFALLAGVAASLVALRRTVTVDPALAFGSPG